MHREANLALVLLYEAKVHAMSGPSQHRDQVVLKCIKKGP